MEVNEEGRNVGRTERRMEGRRRNEGRMGGMSKDRRNE